MKHPPIFKHFCISCDKGYEFGIDGYELYERMVGTYEGSQFLNLKAKYQPICDDCWEKFFDLLWINDLELKHIRSYEISPYELYGNELAEFYSLIIQSLFK